ncbi:MAG: hypothetical protein M1497_00090 [Nitrospirae bacterium]|nr:hypothetical protein [Nitrospirota bacterium]
MKGREKRVLIQGILALFLLVLPLKGYALDIGDTAPDFRIASLDGKEISYYRDIRGKKPVYLVFWATW